MSPVRRRASKTHIPPDPMSANQGPQEGWRRPSGETSRPPTRRPRWVTVLAVLMLLAGARLFLGSLTDLRRLATGRSMAEVSLDGLADANQEVLIRGQIALDEAVDRAHPAAAWVQDLPVSRWRWCSSLPWPRCSPTILGLAVPVWLRLGPGWSCTSPAGFSCSRSCAAGSRTHCPCCSRWPPEPTPEPGMRRPLRPIWHSWLPPSWFKSHS